MARRPGLFICLIGLLAGSWLFAAIPSAPLHLALRQVLIPRIPPTLFTLSTTSGDIGSSLTITGRDFGPTRDDGQVIINGTNQTVVSWADTSLVVTIATGTTSGNVTVRRGGLTSNILTFTVTSSGTTTITPNDATLVRFVVCYNDGVPYSVDTSSPFTCDSPTAPPHVYYVRTDGNNANSGTVNSAVGAWRTVTFACSNVVVATDLVRVQAGTYLESVSCSRNGTSGSPIAYKADGTVTLCHLTFSNNSDLKFVDFNIAPATGGCSGGSGISGTGTNTRLELWNIAVDMGHLSNKGIQFENGGASRALFSSIIIGGSVSNVSGVDTGLTAHGNDNFIGYVDISNIDYIGMGLGGFRNRVYNVLVSGLVQTAGHPDNWFTHANPGTSIGWTNNLIEATYSTGTPSAPDNKWHQMDNTSATPWIDNVFRGNITTSLGSGVYSDYSDTTSNNGLMFYNNSHLLNERASPGNNTAGNFSGLNGLTAWIYNELFYQAWGTGAHAGLEPWQITGPAVVTANYNLAYDPDVAPTFGPIWSAQTIKYTNQNPLLTNVAGLDFTISSTSSPAYHGGGPLTTATSCSGANLNVNRAAFFYGSNAGALIQYSGALAPGDVITIPSGTYTIASVVGNQLTLTTNPTCSAGDGVYWGTNLTPDIGFAPYKSGGYILSATKSGNPSGTTNFTARVYSRYASLTRWVVAS